MKRDKSKYIQCTCAICGKVCSRHTSLANHIHYKHNMTPKEYYDLYIEPGVKHLCIHCNQNETKFINLHLGYATSCGSHDCEIKASQKTKLEKYGDPNYSNREQFSKTMLNRTQEEKDAHYNKAKETREKHKEENPNYLQEVNEKNLATRYERYGKFESDETAEKRKQTCLEHFGVENPFQATDVQEKIKLTNLDKHNVEYPMQSQECLDKRVQTYIKNLGVDNPGKSKECQAKAKQTTLERYGDENYRNIEQQKQTNSKKSEEELNNIIEKRENTCLKRYGIKTYLAICKKPSTISKLSLRLKNVLDANNIPYEQEFRIDYVDDAGKNRYRLYDFKFGNIILELNGDYFHANPKIYKDIDTIRIRKVDILVKDIWLNDAEKQALANKNGFQVIYLWESDMKKMSDKQLVSYIESICTVTKKSSV